MTCGLYCITNKINGKKYFGQSINIKDRKRAYFSSGNFPNDHIKNAFNKYGKENFEFKILFECPEEMLDVCEELLIYLIDTQNPDKGYNKESGGNLNKRLSEEHKKKISDAIGSGEDNPNWRHDLDDDVLVDEYVNQGLSCSEIARIHNSGSQTIIRRLNKLGIDTSQGKISRDDLDDDVLVDEYVNQGLSCHEIARIHNAAYKTIKSHLNKLGIDTSRNYCAPRDDLDDDVLRDEYVNKGLSCSEIARIHDTTPKTIKRHLNKLGIDTSQGKISRDDLDDDVLVDEYVNQGLSCREIAKIHNASSSTIWERLNKLGIDMNRNNNKNTTGFYRVSKKIDPSCRQGFYWVYQYNDENGKRKSINSVDIKKLEVRVKEKGLPWKKL